jgi:hypothetical protein
MGKGFAVTIPGQVHLMERSVSQISRYLDRIGSPLFVQI